jgi:hypothetical protein
MGVGIYLAFNPPVPEAQLGSDGKLLAKHLETFDQLAEAAGVSPLSSFMDQREPLAEEDYEDIADIHEFMASWDEWFAASEGRRTVKGILAVIQEPSNPVRLTGDAVYLPRQLEKLLHCLRLAENRGAQFPIEVAM